MRSALERMNPAVLAAVFLILVTLAAVGLGIPVTRVTEVAVYVLYAMGVNLLIGYIGLVPFGASFFFGLAGYCVAIAGRALPVNEITLLIYSMLFSLAAAVLLGLVILRRRGLYFALLTLAASQIAFEVVYSWSALTGGENGLQGVPRLWFESALVFHFFTLVVVIVALYALWKLVHSSFGRALQAVRDNEQRASALGYNTFIIKLVVFSISGVFVGLGGGLMALLLRGAYANNLSWQHAGDPVLMAALGGVHHFLGPIWGATTFVLLQDKLSALTDNWWLMFAPVIILFAMLSPEGMHGIFRRIMGRDDRWTLVRRKTLLQPAQIPPYQAPVREEDEQASEDQPILTIRGISKRFGSVVTADNISLEVWDHRVHSLIGPNGAGKTTLFNMMSGFLTPDQGSITLKGRDLTSLTGYQRARIGLSRSFQILSIFQHLTTFENVRIAVEGTKPGWRGYWRDAYEDEHVITRAWSLLDAVGLTNRANDWCSDLSHGEKRLLEIALSLAGNTEVLLLDEPLAGLGEADREIVSNLIINLARRHAILLIEHDIDRVLAISDRITVLHQGKLIADGPPSEIARNPEVIAAYMGERQDSRQGIPTVNTGTPEEVAGKLPTVVAPLLEIKQLSAGYDGSTVLEKIDLVLYPNEVITLLGRNGVGKTTALRAIMGSLPASQGSIFFDGRDITSWRPDRINREGIAIVPEGRHLFPNLTVAENLLIAARPGGATLSDIFELFPNLAKLAKARAETLSGGEQQMVAVARALMAPAKLILLDEPFEGLAPTIVNDIRKAVEQISQKVSMIFVEHHAEAALQLASRAYVLVNGKIAFAGSTRALSEDEELQRRLLGISDEATV